MGKRDYIEFVDSWMSRDENVGRSFTYGNAMYDGIRESRFDFDELGIRAELEDSIVSASGASTDWVESLSDDAIAEILDIAELDEYGRYIQEQINDEDKEDIFDDLDMIIEFQTRDEFEEKVQELVDDKCNPELNRRTVAEEYEDSHYLTIKEDEDE